MGQNHSEWVLENRTQGADSQISDAMERRTMVAGGESNRCFFSFFKYIKISPCIIGKAITSVEIQFYV